jgi:hypothetical protein
MGRWVLFAKYIAQICFFWCPIDTDLALFCAVFDPIEMHAHCLGALLFYGIADNAAGCGVIELDWCGICLWPSSSNVVQMSAPALQLSRQRLATLASAAEDMM